MKTNILGFPRIGGHRELKKSLEKYWKKNSSYNELQQTAKLIRQENWKFQQELGVDLIPSNDFSYYDQVLDASLAYGCIPERYTELKNNGTTSDLYFAMARGIQTDKYDITAMEMTKWFDTNYHYIVPEFSKDQNFELFSSKAVDEFKEAKALGILTKPVLISPVTYLLIGKEKEAGFDRIDLLDKLLPVFFQQLVQLVVAGAEYIQLDEPCLSLDLNAKEKAAITKTYKKIAAEFPSLKIILTNYFGCYGDHLATALQLPVHALHIDLSRCPEQLDTILNAKFYNQKQILSLGIVDGRNIWKNDFEVSLIQLGKVLKKLPKENIWISTSCSLLHSPIDLNLETNEQTLPKEVKQWLAFAKQKVKEVCLLKKLLNGDVSDALLEKVAANKLANQNRKTSTLIHHNPTKKRVAQLTKNDSQRAATFTSRQLVQQKALNLPLFPTTTIGSFPQTKEVRKWRSQFKKNEISQAVYDQYIADETEETIRFQESTGIDVLVHGEFERNDMVEYFGEKLEGFAFSSYGWVQSYGSRCVKPPIIYGDVYRSAPMTVKWSTYAQSLTQKPVKGMLTGPVTILQWSFVRNDQPRATTCQQIAFAIRDEVVDLEKAGLQIIQIDEPAIREGLPLRKAAWETYLNWAIESFRISASGVKNDTQIHTHMCYSEFNDIIEHIAAMDADVITIETSRSKMELLDAFVNFKYPNEIGPGVYDIHSPRVPGTDEIAHLLTKANDVLPTRNIWVNPDCGLKTRDWPETKSALINLVNAAKKMRAKVSVEA
ncbi:5-methyltetrahydropteroyltriglutamate--homocysteine S-methyltransferase [Aquimarina agarilytica]|uniref:5-methyltetrahydropteroyltriglutamate-- homocysteine S-methyltransferase n=1 Tax=Aquimarina agarilytica TaxID=1087449 RepID=UPI0002888F23|nr:5-methyltetrahydropteroyltriglutamate--homocysteine S-methyltransferase [Aquimarina agarilytica]